MNPNQSRILLRPRGPAEVFDLAVRVLREAWVPAARLLAVVVLPVWLVCLPACWFTEGHWGLLAVPIVLRAPLQAPFTVLVGRLMFAPDVTVREVLSQSARAAPGLAAGLLVSGVATLLSSLTCFLALPLVDAALLYVPEATLLERVPLQRALRRSQRLAGARLGLAAAGAGAWWALTVWGAAVGESTWQALLDTVLQLGTPLGSALTGHVTPGLLAGMLLAQPLHAVYRMLLYVDARTRSEGWDLQVSLRAAGLAGAPR